jgi:hypothetical protein
MDWAAAPQTGFIADVVDAMLAADKELAGMPQWDSGNRDGESRLVWPVLLQGRLVGITLNITAYPADPPLRYTITLNVPPCVWRLDFEHPYKRHKNGLSDGKRLGAYVINGPNFHAWPDNRHLATPAILPKKLECARAFDHAATFNAGLRWFCGETKILLRRDQEIDFPARERLI